MKREPRPDRSDTRMADQMGASVEWMDLSAAVFGESRPMEPGEREALDEFVWAELES